MHLKVDFILRRDLKTQPAVQLEGASVHPIDGEPDELSAAIAFPDYLLKNRRPQSAPLLDRGNHDIDHPNFVCAIIQPQAAYRLTVEQYNEILGVWKLLPVAVPLRIELHADQYLALRLRQRQQRELLAVRAVE